MPAARGKRRRKESEAKRAGCWEGLDAWGRVPLRASLSNGLVGGELCEHGSPVHGDRPPPRP